MNRLKFILALHDHQPVGNFDGVFRSAYRDAYRPFLDLMEEYPAIPFVLHTSGPLFEWLDANEPKYLDRVRALVAQGRVEILGGPFSEPILTMIPHRDRVGQIRLYSERLKNRLGATVRGAWLPERVWEQQLVRSFVEAGLEYTILDDVHFLRTGLSEEELLGYYLTEDEGKLLKIFPASERLRYLMPFQEPHASYEYLRKIAETHPGSTVVFADDGEKFGSWPQTFNHVYTNGWLKRFCDMVVGNLGWLQPMTFARVADSARSLGKVYLSDSSYREMNEWVLSPDRVRALAEVKDQARGNQGAERLLPLVRAAGFWRNFKRKYPETDAMYSRMLGLSDRLAKHDPADNPAAYDAARIALYQGQCNCPYWHGAFGGLYLPHLRSAIYEQLIEADNQLDVLAGRNAPHVAIEVGDFDLDGQDDVRIENDRLLAFFRPALGGHLHELDDRRTRLNLLATLDRRPEPYHHAIATGSAGAAGVHDRVNFPQEEIDRVLVYDRSPRKALVDHFFRPDTTLDSVQRDSSTEIGDFASGPYEAKCDWGTGDVTLTMARDGSADGLPVRIEKRVRLAIGVSTLEIAYTLSHLPAGRRFQFGIEFNVAGMAGHADDRLYTSLSGERLGMLDARLNLESSSGVRLRDDWRDLTSEFRWSAPATLWCFPVETVSQSEAGFETVYQSSVVLPVWDVQGDADGTWSVSLRWTLGDRTLGRKG